MAERKLVGTGAEPWHGTPGGYSNHKCGCTRCRAAHAEDHARMVAEVKVIPDHVDPDSYHAYRYYHSRTPGALAANAARRARQRERKRESSR